MAEEVNDAWQEPDSGHGPAGFPVGDGQRVGAELLGNVPLAKPEVEPPLAEVISYRDKDLRVGTW